MSTEAADPKPTPKPVTKLQYWLGLIWTWICLLLWTFVTEGALVIVYFFLTSRGIVYLIPESAQLLSELPGLSRLADYEETHELQVAHAAAEILLLLTFVSWQFLLRWVISEEFKEKFRSWKWSANWVEKILLTAPILIVVGDMGLFYEALTYSAFGEGTFSAKMLVGTLVYGVILVMVNFVSLYLARCVREAQEKECVDAPKRVS